MRGQGLSRGQGTHHLRPGALLAAGLAAAPPRAAVGFAPVLAAAAVLLRGADGLTTTVLTGALVAAGFLAAAVGFAEALAGTALAVLLLFAGALVEALAGAFAVVLATGLAEVAAGKAVLFLMK